MSLTFTTPVRRNKPKRRGSLAYTGGNSSFVIDKSGQVWAWGAATAPGRADSLTTGIIYTPVSIAGAVKTFCQISVARQTSLAIDKNGRAWGWGYNVFANLGDNATATNRSTPVAVAGALKTFCKITAGINSGLAIDKYGRAWAWGRNANGELGDNTITQRNTPISVLGAVKTFCEISGTGGGSTTAIDKNGQVWAWGFNGQGQLGDNTTVSKLTPVSILGAVKTFCQISSGASFTIAIDKNGRAWGWGYNAGRIGDGTSTSRLTPVSVVGAIKTFCKIAAGSSRLHNLAIDKYGTLWAWGNNGAGELGDNTTVGKNTPVRVCAANKTFCEVGAGMIGGGAFTGAATSLGIDKNGRVWAWGSNVNGRLGNNNPMCKCTPISVLGAVKTFCIIAGGNNENISHAIDKNGKVWGWGDNTNRAIGDNTTAGRYTPVSILGAAKTFCHIHSGQTHTVGITNLGRAWAWGANDLNQLGDNTTTARGTPVSVLGAVKTFCSILAGYRSSRALDKNGMIWSWGANNVGQLGDNTVALKATPVSLVGATKTFCKIGVQGNLVTATTVHAIDKNGQLWGWGYNGQGQLGDNTKTNRLTPVSVVGATKTFCEISRGGGNFTIAIDKNGSAWGWGSNGVGQLGDNTTTSRCTPVAIAGANKTFCKISKGNQHTLAIDKNGTVWAWGDNSSGQLGDNSNTSKRTPVSILGSVKTFCHISGGPNHSLAIDKNGRAWGWGYNTRGQLGDFPLTLTPIQVCNI